MRVENCFRKYFGLFIACVMLYCSFRAAAQEANIATKQQLSENEQRKLDYFYYEGINLKNAEQYDASYEMFKHCLSIDSTSSAALFEIASYYIQMNQPELSVSLIKKALAYSPDNQEYRNTLATLLFQMGMFGEAADEYTILVKNYPDKPELNYYLAESYTRMGEIGKAIDTYDQLESGIGMSEALSMQKFQLYMTLKQSEKAFNEIKKLADKYPMEARYPLLIGDLYLNENDTAQAYKYYEKAHEIDPESPYYPVSMANYYERIGRKEAAKQQINNALVNERLDVETKANILARYIQQLHRSKQEIDGANSLFETLLKQHPNDSRLKNMYGQFLMLQDKKEEARFQFQTVTESDPENLQAWQALLQMSLQEEKMDSVINICRKCQEIFPNAAEFYFYLGIAYYQKKEYKNAIETYKSGISIVPEENVGLISDFYGQIGDTYFKTNVIDSAFHYYEEALKYNDKNIVVLNNYAYYLSLLKRDLPKAERMSALSIKLAPDNSTYIDTYAWIFFVEGNYPLAKVYIEKAIENDKTNSAELLDHYGDILFMSGEKDKALEQWKKAKESGKDTQTLNKKIEEQQYFEDTEESRIKEAQNVD